MLIGTEIQRWLKESQQRCQKLVQFNDLAFHGGTSLRLLHRIDRYIENESK